MDSSTSLNASKSSSQTSIVDSPPETKTIATQN